MSYFDYNQIFYYQKIFFLESKLKQEGEPCGHCFRHWCPDSCKDDNCGNCDKGLKCKRVSKLREHPGECVIKKGKCVITFKSL